MTQSEMIRAIYDDMQDLKEDVHILKEDVHVLKEDVSVLKEDVQDLKVKVEVLREDVDDLKEDVSALKENVTGIQLTLENETNRNIRVVAEGHLDLNRKLDDALKVENEKEMMHLRINVLENDMRRVKEKIGIA
ncbi:MAG: hypothetical protein J6J38_06715 [Lachnospiraceae bacterium]|nr:hypothetical protein [Lachnospiraceae bacterium]